MKLELKTRLAQLAELADGDLHTFQCEVVDELATLPEGEESTAGIGTLHALTAAGDCIRRELDRRESIAAVAEPEPGPAKPGKVARMAARQAKPKPSPELAPEGQRTALLASGNLRGQLAGAELDRHALALALCDTLAGRERPQGLEGARGQDVIVASASWRDQYPEERRLTGDLEADGAKWHAVTEPDALVATGGICAPVNVDWSIDMIATAERPVQAALPAFQANRGGLIYRPNLDFSATSSAVGIWTEATDLAPAGATKPILQIACPGTETVYVQAVSYRLGFGNLQSRFDPETVAASADAVLAAQARVAENSLLNLIGAACTQGVTSGKVLGSMRDLLTTIGQCVAAYRNLHRVPRTQALRAILPDWARELIRIDLAREIAHAQNADFNALAVTDEQIDEMLGVWGVSPIWHLDGQSTSAPGLSGAVSQLFTAQTASAAVQSFPTDCVWYLFHEGAFQYLDGGTLDLGIVRDSLLDATNDWEAFAEVFETVAFRGFTGAAIQLISTLCSNGASAGTVSTTSSCA